MSARPPVKAQNAPSGGRQAKTHYVIRFAGHAGLAALFIAVALLGVLSGVMFAYAGDLPLISAEDKDFNNHFGLSVSALVLRLGNDVLHRRWVQGASTLTMQLARSLFAEEVGFQIGDKSPERKIKEILVAIQI